MLLMSKQPQNRIREIRKNQKMTQGELASAVGGCSDVQIGKLERGAGGLTVHWMRLIAKALGVYPSDLLIDEDRRPGGSVVAGINEALLENVLKAALLAQEESIAADKKPLTPQRIAGICSTLYLETCSNPPPFQALHQQCKLLFKFAHRL